MGNMFYNTSVLICGLWVSLLGWQVNNIFSVLTLVARYHVHRLLYQVKIELLIRRCRCEIKVLFCYFCDLFLGGQTSSDSPLIVAHEFRLSLSLSAPSHSVVHGAFASALSSSRDVQVNQRRFKIGTYSPINKSLAPRIKEGINVQFLLLL